MSDEFTQIKDPVTAKRVAIQENAIRELLGSAVDGAEKIIQRVAEFLAYYEGINMNMEWGGLTLLSRVSPVAQLMADVSCISEYSENGVEPVVLSKIFLESNLFKPFYMASRDFDLAKEDAAERISRKFPGGTWVAHLVLEKIAKSLEQNIPAVEQ